MRLLIGILAIFIFSCQSIAQVSGLAGWNIFLDPGHSQKENMGIYGYSEAERNLRVGLRLREYLLNTTDIDTVYICRTNDQQYLTLSQRTDYANRLGAAWYHSIHSDAGAPGSNSTLLLWGQDYYGNEKVPNGGKAMSSIMVDILTRGMRTNTRGSYGDCTFYSYTGACSQGWPGPYLHVNRRTTMASELSESGFHTNPRQNQLFMNDDWKRLEAKTFYWSILKFFGIERPVVGTCTGIISDIESNQPLNNVQVALDEQNYTTDSFSSLFYKYTDDPELLHNGFYYFENLTSGTKPLIVSAEGYYSDTLQVSIVDTFFTFEDVKLISRTPPVVLQTIPAEGDTNFPAWDDIIVYFSRPMNIASVENNLTIMPETTISFQWTENNKTMKLITDSLEFETNYTITISGNTKDMYNHPVDGNGDGAGGDDYSFDFKTGPPDMVAPNIVESYPPQTGSNIELHPIINIMYDEEIDTTSLAEDIFKFERFQDRSLVAGVLKHYAINERSSLCFFPDEQLHHDEVYITRISPGVYDLFGNIDTGGKSLSFRTSKYYDRINAIDNFESQITGNWWAPQQSGSTAGIITESTSREVEKNITNLLTGSNNSLKLNYGWDINADSWLLREYLGGGSPRSKTFNRNHLLQVYIFGDGSNNKFRFCVDDNYPNAAASNHEVSPWYAIDWIGWKLVSWDMTNDSTGTWLGDGNLDGVLRFDSIQLTYNPSSSITGTLYFDDLQVVEKVMVNVENHQPVLPTEFILSQNYPNPFNANTTINYHVPDGNNHIVLEIYDVLGKKVRTLVNEELSAGEYSILWDGKDDKRMKVSSGIYLYKFSTGDVTISRRMTLLK